MKFHKNRYKDVTEQCLEALKRKPTNKVNFFVCQDVFEVWFCILLTDKNMFVQDGAKLLVHEHKSNILLRYRIEKEYMEDVKLELVQEFAKKYYPVNDFFSEYWDYTISNNKQNLIDMLNVYVETEEKTSKVFR